MSRGERAVSLRVHVALVAVPLAIAVAVGCGSDGGRERGDGLAVVAGADVAGPAAATGDGGDDAADGTGAEAVVDVVVDASDFRPLADMTAVRGFFVDNVAGDLEGTLAVAEDPGSAPYPVGSVIQLIPQEAMVKRGPSN